jgi:titin
MGNYIGLHPDGVGALRNDWYGVYIGGGAQNNIIGGDRTTGEGNVISGNGNYGIAFVDDAAGNVVSGNLIGPAAAGTTPLPNGDTGVQMGNLTLNNTIGGSTPGRGNIISGNARNGITIEGSGNFFFGNLIGLAGDGATSLPNSQDGIQIGPLAQNNTIGGATPGQRNIISSNSGYGVLIEGSNNVFSGNFVGTDAGGTVARGNAVDGMYLSTGANNNLIGGEAPGEGNLISGNGDDGISLDGASNNRVSGNYIGTNAAGTALLGESDFGIYIGGGAKNNIIGGDQPAAGNIIAGCRRDGIYIANSTTEGNVIAYNRIGTDFSGTLDLGNGQSGIEMDFGTHGNVIGPGNVVAYNNYPGVMVDEDSTIDNTITQNSIFANTGKGIALSPGAQGGILPPVILTVNPRPITVAGTACPGCTVELFGSTTNEGQGQCYLGSATSDGSGAFRLVRPDMPYAFLTATATDPTQGTSEFSAVFTTTIALFTHLPIMVR